MKFKIEPQPYRPGASFLTLLEKEILRFKKIALQTIFAPVLMGLLYLLVFGQVLAGKMPTFDGVNYLHFLVPGLVMMTMLQNAFGNSSSSMLSSKIMGSLIFIQLPPFAGWELSLAMIGASIVRCLNCRRRRPLGFFPLVSAPDGSSSLDFGFRVYRSSAYGLFGIDLRTLG